MFYVKIKYNYDKKDDNMRISELMKKTFCSSCILFAFITVLFSLTVILFGEGMGMNPTSVFLLFPFSCFVTLANYIFKYGNFANCGKVVIHFLIYTTSIIVFIGIPHGKGFSPKSLLILFFVYLVIYIVSLAVYLGTKASKLRKSEKKSEYKNVY